MKSRGNLGKFVVKVTICSLVASVVWAGGMAIGVGVEFSQVLPFGMGFGVFIGTILFCLRLIPHKVITNSVVFQDKETFLSRLKLALAKVSYQSKSETDELWMCEYKGGDFWGGRLVLENISIQIEESSATITGPKSVVETLQQELNERH